MLELPHPHDYPGGVLSAICYTARTGWARVADLSRISELLQERDLLLWATADARELSEADVAQIAEEFGLHPLAVEDAMELRQRPKLEAYPDHLFVVAHEIDVADGGLDARQAACFVGERYVLVIHSGADRVLGEARARLQRPTRPEPALIVHALLDAIVDEFATAAEALEDEVERLEDHILGKPHEHQAGLFSLRRRMTHLRRFAVPTERLLEQILEGRANLGEHAPEAFRDVHDHTLRVNDTLRSVTDVAAAVFDLQRSEQSQRLSDITKRLSGWAAIIAVPTLIASAYGMNFALIPKEGSTTGFAVAVAAMVVSGVALWLVMRKRGWV